MIDGGAVALLLTGLGGAGLLGFGLFQSYRSSRARGLQVWSNVARRAKVTLDLSAQAAWGRASLSGRWEGLRVTLRQLPGMALSAGIEITVTGLDPDGRMLTVEPQSLARELAARLGSNEIEIGDPAFDAEFSLQGDPLLAQAVLGATTRERLAKLLRGSYLGWNPPIKAEATLANSQFKVVLTVVGTLHEVAFANQLGNGLGELGRGARPRARPGEDRHRRHRAGLARARDAGL